MEARGGGGGWLKAANVVSEQGHTACMSWTLLHLTTGLTKGLTQQGQKTSPIDTSCRCQFTLANCIKGPEINVACQGAILVGILACDWTVTGWFLA